MSDEEKQYHPDSDDYLYELGMLRHEPVIPPRKGHTGEEVFATAWRLIMERNMPGNEYSAPNAMLWQMLTSLPDFLTQRHASVAASLICWLGTNCGRSFISQAQRLADIPSFSPRQAWLSTWALENRRNSSINSGCRTIEHLLAPSDHFGNTPYGYALIRTPELSVTDHEVIEDVVEWLSTEEGASFILDCEAEIEQRSKAEWLRKGLAATRPTEEINPA